MHWWHLTIISTMVLLFKKTINHVRGETPPSPLCILMKAAPIGRWSQSSIGTTNWHCIHTLLTCSYFWDKTSVRCLCFKVRILSFEHGECSHDEEERPLFLFLNSILFIQGLISRSNSDSDLLMMISKYIHTYFEHRFIIAYLLTWAHLAAVLKLMLMLITHEKSFM